VANLGVIASGALVLLTHTRYPDLVVGMAIGLYVMREAGEILERARQAKVAAET
jgi:Co/Zn/Cd efflux system component